MATKFAKGDTVTLDSVLPTGPVLAFRMDSDGIVFCLIEWTDSEGSVQQRWFKEDDLIAA
jgi:uncharacterized protein YodC (DUF2158 family)|tara:strand:- start:259 stop:438 length:180 start_codon:yes stop_codon:yes gene_type:complete